MVSMVKQGKESPMYVYSERDIEYLERRGWVRQAIEREERIQFHEDTEKLKQMAAQPRKRGRPRKP